jgi:2-oxoglutarate ferredoxin oxidoreductase subunit gamma
MNMDIILSGFGGQGVLSAGLMLSESAILEGLNTTYFPSYGAEMRGGTANCHIRISDKEIASPIVLSSDILIAMSRPALKKFMPGVKAEGGRVLFNSDAAEKIPGSEKYSIIALACEKLALEKFGSPKSSNMIMIGAFIRMSKILSLDSIKKAILGKFGKKGQNIVDMNYLALALGYDAAEVNKL